MYLHVGAQAWNMEHWRDEHKAQKSVKKVYLSTDELYLSTDAYSHSKTELRFASLSVSVDRCNVPVDRYTQTTQDRAQVFSSWVHLSTDANCLSTDTLRNSFSWNPVLSLSLPVDRCKCTCRQPTETSDFGFPNPAPLGCFLPPRPPPLPNTI